MMEKSLNRSIDRLNRVVHPKEVFKATIEDIAYKDWFDGDKRTMARWELDLSPQTPGLAECVAYFPLLRHEADKTFGSSLTTWLQEFLNYADGADEEVELDLSDLIGAKVLIQYTGYGKQFELLQVLRVPAVIEDVGLEPGDTDVDEAIKRFEQN
ncbi:hypothetical protein LIX87_05960 [Weissella viridescens]|uniref:hypothetical protein n=1 Tax=Weissella viridescens TaxID=1629 RepID=UPI001D06B281|nr:hypothetical protein [Weissella viridescens]MCB6840615.1 hypothetical protein [Weissella viridescens]MCB6847277.1 hypothetical protein [Weissella viridescens]